MDVTLGLFYTSVIFVQGIVEMHSFLVNNNILLHLVFEFFLKSTKTIRSLLILNANSISTKNIQITIHMIILFFKIITEKKKLNSSIISSIFIHPHTHTHTQVRYLSSKSLLRRAQWEELLNYSVSRQRRFNEGGGGEMESVGDA